MDKAQYFKKLVALTANGGYCKIKKRPDPEDGKEPVTVLQ